MSDKKEQPQEDPAEGSREMIDRELKRDDNKGDQTSKGSSDRTDKTAAS